MNRNRFMRVSKLKKKNAFLNHKSHIFLHVYIISSIFLNFPEFPGIFSFTRNSGNFLQSGNTVHIIVRNNEFVRCCINCINMTFTLSFWVKIFSTTIIYILFSAVVESAQLVLNWRLQPDRPRV